MRKYGDASVPVPATHCQPWLLEAMSPSRRWSQEVPRAVRPPDVQVLDQEAGHDHPHPVVDPALGQQLAHAGVDEREAGAPLLPRLEQLRVLRRVVVRHRPELLLEVAPRRVGPVPQHVGVELAPGQLGRRTSSGPCRGSRGARRGRPAGCGGGSRRTSGTPTAGRCRTGPAGPDARRSPRCPRRGTRASAPARPAHPPAAGRARRRRPRAGPRSRPRGPSAGRAARRPDAASRAPARRGRRG